MAVKSLKIDSLELDLLNPRIPPATDQRDAMQKIISEQKGKLINLAESVAVHGFSPDRCIILRSPDRPNKFIVLEGNRRVLVAKLLKNPSLVPTLEMPEAHRKRLLSAAKNFDIGKVEPVDCYEVPDRAAGNDWINRRHTGEDEGRGIVGWSAIARARFKGRDPALQALDFVMAHGKLTDQQKEAIAGKFPFTTLDRLISTPSVRKSIGFEIEDGKLQTELPPDEALKPLKRIILDLVDKVVTVTHLKSKDQQNAYINNLKSEDKPNLSRKTGTLTAVEGMTDLDFKQKAPTKAKTRAVRTPARTTVVPRTCKLNVNNPKIFEIYSELRVLQLTKHPHAIAVLLRVFLETSVDHYLTAAGILLTYPTPQGKKDKSPKVKVKEAIDEMVNSGSDKKNFHGVHRAMDDVNHPFSLIRSTPTYTAVSIRLLSAT